MRMFITPMMIILSVLKESFCLKVLSIKDNPQDEYLHISSRICKNFPYSNMMLSEKYLEEYGISVESHGVTEWCPVKGRTEISQVLAVFYDQSLNQKENYFLTIEEDNLVLRRHQHDLYSIKLNNCSNPVPILPEFLSEESTTFLFCLDNNQLVYSPIRKSMEYLTLNKIPVRKFKVEGIDNRVKTMTGYDQGHNVLFLSITDASNNILDEGLFYINTNTSDGVL